MPTVTTRPTVVLAIDPGEATGWVLYCSKRARVLAAGQFRRFEIDIPRVVVGCADVFVIERPRVWSGSPPAIGDTCITAGILWERIGSECEREPEWIYRDEVKKALTRATYGEVHCKDDKSVWQALKRMHGGEPSAAKARIRKGKVVEEPGAIGAVSSHERAALAAGVAWLYMQGRITT